MFPQCFYFSSIRATQQLTLEEHEAGCSVTQEPTLQVVLSP